MVGYFDDLASATRAGDVEVIGPVPEGYVQRARSASDCEPI